MCVCVCEREREIYILLVSWRASDSLSHRYDELDRTIVNANVAVCKSYLTANEHESTPNLDL